MFKNFLFQKFQNTWERLQKGDKLSENMETIFRENKIMNLKNYLLETIFLG